MVGYAEVPRLCPTYYLFIIEVRNKQKHSKRSMTSYSFKELAPEDSSISGPPKLGGLQGHEPGNPGVTQKLQFVFPGVWSCCWGGTGVAVGEELLFSEGLNEVLHVWQHQ